MADHPFHGNWRSYVVGKTDLEVRGSFFELEITPAGLFRQGKRKKPGYETDLDGTISNGEITLRERGGDDGTFRGQIRSDLSDTRVKVLVGEANYPEKAKKVLQNDGIWIATQP